MSELKPCPFCGSSQLHMHDDGYIKWVECEDCLAEGPVIVGSEESATDIWNTRQGETP